jgi:hypothetical protein
MLVSTPSSPPDKRRSSRDPGTYISSVLTSHPCSLFRALQSRQCFRNESSALVLKLETLQTLLRRLALHSHPSHQEFKMYSIITVIPYILLVEILRRCYLALIAAFTGPLSKIPGPFLNKLTPIPWLINPNLRGTHSNIVPDLFKKYGDIVRVGPREIIIAEKSAIQKIIAEKDFRKSRDFEFVREDREIASIFTETDKSAHRQRVRKFLLLCWWELTNGARDVFYHRDSQSVT